MIHSTVTLNSWLQHLPSVSEVRPTHCSTCGAAGNRPGMACQLHGHGLRERQILGPLSPDEPPTINVVAVRRYRCARCGATCTVVPQGVLERRYYSRSAIGMAMVLYGLEACSPGVVRSRVSPWQHVGSAPGKWMTLKRWLRAVGQGKLFAFVRPIPLDFSYRAAAERVATTLASMAPAAPRHRSWRERVFSLGAHTE